MKGQSKLFLLAIVTVVVIGGFIVFKLRKHHEPTPETDGEKSAGPARVKRAANGEVTVTLDEETQKRLALKTETVAPAQIQSERKGHGSALDPAPLAALINELATAHVAAQASGQEFERLKLLTEQDNASARALQAAAATAHRDQLLIESLRTKLALTGSQALEQRENLPEFSKALTTRQTALVRIDLPAGESLPVPPASARLVSLADETKPFTGEFFDEAPAVDLQTQGQGFLFLVKSNSAKLAPGAAVTGWLQIPGAPMDGLIVPRPAVVRHAGAGWVYVQTNGTNFSRHLILLDRPVEHGWFVTNGVAAGDPVVVTGAQTLLSEELNAGGGKD